MTSNSDDNARKHDSGGFAGTLRNIQIIDIIQMCCLAGASLSIRVRQGSDHGTIFIEDGEVVHAQCGSLTGAKAFFTILAWPSGQFETMEASAINEPTIKEACQFLLMEAARQADELALLNSDAEAEPEETLELWNSQKLRILVVDDSPIMCKILSSMLSADSSIEVIGTAKNGEDALKKMKQLSPDLITMDVNMPVMDGSTALKHIMISSPCPVLIVSNLLPSSYDTLLSFLNLGAADFMSKPVKSSDIVLQQQRIVERVHEAAKANMKRFQLLRCPKLNPSEFIQIDDKTACDKVLIINSGTGGYLEMVNLVTALPNASSTTVLSLQSIPPKFAPTLSSFLNARSRFKVKSLKEKTILNRGGCYIGTNGKPMQFSIEDGMLVLETSNNREDLDARESVDSILSSATELFQNRVSVVLLSGGNIGTMDGLRAVKSAGGKILAPKPKKAILPDTFMGAVGEGLVTDVFDFADIKDILAQHCK